MSEEWYGIAFRIDPDVTVGEAAAMLKGLDAFDVMLDWMAMEFSRDGLFIEGQHPEENWDAIVKWCSKTEGIEIEWDLMSEWLCDEEAERCRCAWRTS